MFRRDIPIHFFILSIMFLEGCATTMAPKPEHHGAKSASHAPGQGHDPGPDKGGASFLDKIAKEHSFKNPYFLAQSESSLQGLFLNSAERILWVKNKSIEMRDYSAEGSSVQKFLQNQAQNWSHASWSKNEARLFLTGSDKNLPS